MTRILVTVVCALLLSGSVVAELHSSQLPELTAESTFPRMTPEELVSYGFPDHLHAQWWPGWEVMTDTEGVTYGPGAFCDRKTPVPREGLIFGDDFKAYGHYVVRHNPGYAPCDMTPLLEMVTWAARVNEELLGLTSSDTLTIISPDNIPSYRELTGQDVWRLYALKDDVCIIEPYGTLQARTLDGHAGFMLVTDWLLHENLPQDLPPWLHQGLVEYIGDDGVHLVNYMAEFRNQGNVVFSPPLTDALLAQGVDPDRGRDREMYRRACYSAFLMVWRLVEDEGGLAAMCRFLELVAGGADLDQASSEVYGATMNELAQRLDPAKLGEPIGDAVGSRKPSKRP